MINTGKAIQTLPITRLSAAEASAPKVVTQAVDRFTPGKGDGDMGMARALRLFDGGGLLATRAGWLERTPAVDALPGVEGAGADGAPPPPFRPAGG